MFNIKVVIHGQTIQPGSQIPFRREISDAVSRNWDKSHDRPVAHKASHQSCQTSAPTRKQHNHRSYEVHDGDPLQHARYSPSRQVKMRKAIEKEPNRKDQECPANRMTQQGIPRFAFFLPICDRIDHGNANNEQKEREYQVCRRPSVPLGVLQWPVDVLPVTGIIHQHHACNGQPAEYIE